VTSSIRFRITALAVVLVAVVLGVAAVVLVQLHERQLRDSLDRSLGQRADQIEASLSVPDSADPFANTDREDRVAQLLDPQGGVIAGVGDLGPVADEVLAVQPTRQRFVTVSELPQEDDGYRLLFRPVTSPSGSAVLVVGENTDELDDSVRTLTVLLATVIPLVVLVLGAVVWWLVGRTLRPVEDIRRQVSSIELDQLDERVPVPGADDEISRLATTMNAMLDRLDDAADRQRRFVADASHELRSPLTRMRTTLEVDRHDPDADHRRTCDQVLDDAIAMQRMVDDLLFLARRDGQATLGESAAIDLDVLVDEEVQQARTQTEVTLDQSAVSAAVVSGRRSDLARLVRNLLDNAVRHAERQVAVSLVDHRDGGVVLMVDDDGPGIDPSDRQRVFERFTRLDDARQVGVGGTGLGLAIAAEIAHDHGGTIEVRDGPLGGARLVVVLG